MIEMDPELAEVCGIHAGDGYLRDDGKRRELDISGNLEEQEYYDNHVVSLFESLFNIKINAKIFPSRNTYGFVIRAKEIIKLFNELGFPYGNKSTTVQVPKYILESDNIIICARFLRGLFDTDGCVSFIKRPEEKYCEFKRKYNYYPSLKFTTVSENLSKDILIMLKKLEFGHITIYKYKSKILTENVVYSLIFYGPDKMRKFFDIIGSKNNVKLSRYLVWEKFGFCPTNLNLQQRKDILNGKLDPYLVGP